jgi:translation initiation factor IF-2
MSKKRVYEIAKEQGLSSKELLARLAAAGVEARAASSSVEESLALRAIGGDGASPAQAPARPAQAEGGAPAPRPGGRAGGRAGAAHAGLAHR